MKIHVRAAAGLLVLVGLLAAIGAGVTIAQRKAVDERIDASTLEAVHATQRQVESAKVRELALTSRALGADPALIGYITQALASSVETGGDIDVASIRDLLEERRRELRFDLLAVADPSLRHVVAAGDVGDARALAADSLVRAVAGGGAAGTGLWGEGERLWLVSATPLLRGANLEAVLISGQSLDAAFARSIAHDGHAHVTLIDVSRTAPRAVASTLEADDTARLLAAVESRRSARPAAGAPGDDHFPIALDGGETRAAVAPLFGDEAKALLASIVPLDQKRAAIDAVRWPLLIGAAAMLVVLLAFAWMLQRRVFKPVADLGDLSERMLRGDYKLVARTDGSPDVARIGAAINKLLTDLRGYKEAIEQRQKRP